MDEGERETAKQHFMQTTTRLFVDAVDTGGFKPTVLGIDRHGSYVWEAVRHDALNRYIMLGFTAGDDPAEEHAPLPGMDIYAGADNGHRFRRLHLDVGESPATNRAAHLTAALRSATRLAEALTEDDLTEAFVVPRDEAPVPVTSPFPR